MRKFTQLFIVGAISLLPLIPQSVQAKECNIPADQIDYKGPYSTLFSENKYELECGFLPSDSNFLNQVISSSKVNCVKGVLDPNLVGDIDKINIQGESGTISVSSGDVSTYALGGNVLTQENDQGNTYEDQLTAYKKVVAANENYTLSNLYQDAYADGVNSYSEFLAWANERGLTVTSSDGSFHLNPSIFTAAQVETTLSDQILYAYQTAQEILRCDDSDYAKEHQCSTFFLTRKDGSQEKISNIASMVHQRINPDDLVGSFDALTDQEKWQMLIIHLAKHEQSFFLFVPITEVCTGTAFQCAFSDFFANFRLTSPPQPKYIQVILPESTTIKEGVLAEYARFNPLTNNPEYQAAHPSPRLVAAVDNPDDVGGGSDMSKCSGATDPLTRKLCAKALADDPHCTSEDPDKKENLGATSNAVSTGPISANFIFQLLDKMKARVRMELYYVYHFIPPDSQEADKLLASDPNSVFRMLLPLSEGNALDEVNFDNYGVPVAANSEADNNTVPYEEAVQVPMYDEDDNLIGYENVAVRRHLMEYSAMLKDFTIPGFASTLWHKFNSFWISKPLNDPNRIGSLDMCLLEQHLAPANSSFNLVRALNADQFNQSNCPNPFGNDLPDAICSDMESLSVKSGCELSCDSFNIDSTGTHEVPPSLKQLIELAASAYDVPPGLILGSLYAEGGFEPRCAGDDRNYSEAEIQDTLQCPASSTCCNGNRGIFAVNPGYFNKALIDAKNKLNMPVDEANPGSMCNSFDSALVIAHNLGVAHGTFDASLWHRLAVETCNNPTLLDLCTREDGSRVVNDPNSCQGITYAGNAPFSCRNWTENNAMVAIRVQQGLCGDGNTRMDAHAQQILRVFRQCN